MYCSGWIFDIVCAQITADYIRHDVPLRWGGQNYMSSLSTQYDQLDGGEVIKACEDMLRFLDRVKAGEISVTLLEGFIFFRLYYARHGAKRNLRPFFRPLISGTKTKQYTRRQSIRRFRAYIYAYRSEKAVLAPPGWSLAEQQDVTYLAEIARQHAPPFSPPLAGASVPPSNSPPNS